MAVYYVCQTYEYKDRGNGKTLEKSNVIECKSANDAILRVEKMFKGGQYAGVDAFEVDVDEEAGEYGEPTFLLRLGDVPDIED